MEKRNKTSRRKFLSLGLATGGALVTSELHAVPSGLPNENKAIILLTPDGKLVEVNKQIIEAAKMGKKASNQEILIWTQATPSKS